MQVDEHNSLGSDRHAEGGVEYVIIRRKKEGNGRKGKERKREGKEHLLLLSLRVSPSRFYFLFICFLASVTQHAADRQLCVPVRHGSCTPLSGTRGARHAVPRTPLRVPNLLFSFFGILLPRRTAYEGGRFVFLLW